MVEKSRSKIKDGVVTSLKFIEGLGVAALIAFGVNRAFLRNTSPHLTHSNSKMEHVFTQRKPLEERIKPKQHSNPSNPSNHEKPQEEEIKPKPHQPAPNQSDKRKLQPQEEIPQENTHKMDDNQAERPHGRSQPQQENTDKIDNNLKDTPQQNIDGGELEEQKIVEEKKQAEPEEDIAQEGSATEEEKYTPKLLSTFRPFVTVDSEYASMFTTPNVNDNKIILLASELTGKKVHNLVSNILVKNFILAKNEEDGFINIYILLNFLQANGVSSSLLGSELDKAGYPNLKKIYYQMTSGFSGISYIRPIFYHFPWKKELARLALELFDGDLEKAENFFTDFLATFTIKGSGKKENNALGVYDDHNIAYRLKKALKVLNILKAKAKKELPLNPSVKELAHFWMNHIFAYILPSGNGNLQFLNMRDLARGRGQKYKKELDNNNREMSNLKGEEDPSYKDPNVSWLLDKDVLRALANYYKYVKKNGLDEEFLYGDCDDFAQLFVWFIKNFGYDATLGVYRSNKKGYASHVVVKIWGREGKEYYFDAINGFFSDNKWAFDKFIEKRVIGTSDLYIYYPYTKDILPALVIFGSIPPNLTAPK